MVILKTVFLGDTKSQLTLGKDVTDGIFQLENGATCLSEVSQACSKAVASMRTFSDGSMRRGPSNHPVLNAMWWDTLLLFEDMQVYLF